VADPITFRFAQFPPCYNCGMLRMLTLLFGLIARSLRSREALLLENLALCQQLAVLTLKHPPRRFFAPDRLFWVILRRFWSGWKQSLLIVQPKTIVGWHRAGFKMLLALALATQGSDRPEVRWEKTARIHLPHDGQKPDVGTEPIWDLRNRLRVAG
jgi:hypothetical protein